MSDQVEALYSSAKRSYTVHDEKQNRLISRKYKIW